MQNRLDDVLQPRALADNLITPRHLPSQRLGAWIGDPDFRQEAAGVELASTAASILSVLILASR